MSNPFFDHPILNTPYEYPMRYWELDETGQPTQNIIERRGSAKFITPIPKPKKRCTIGIRVRRRQRAFDSVKARYRLVRRKFRATKRRVGIRLLLFTLKARYQMLIKGRIALAFCGRWLATIAGLF